MALGLVMVVAAVLWLSTRPSLSVKSRMQRSVHSHNAGPLQEAGPAKSAIGQPRATSREPRREQKLSGFQTHQQVLDADPVDLRTSISPDTTLASHETTTKKTMTPRFHIVRTGETLSGISYRYYGSASKWQKIRDANRKTIKDANRLRPGTKLIIPQ